MNKKAQVLILAVAIISLTLLLLLTTLPKITTTTTIPNKIPLAKQTLDSLSINIIANITNEAWKNFQKDFTKTTNPQLINEKANNLLQPTTNLIQTHYNLNIKILNNWKDTISTSPTKIEFGSKNNKQQAICLKGASISMKTELTNEPPLLPIKIRNINKNEHTWEITSNITYITLDKYTGKLKTTISVKKDNNPVKHVLLSIYILSPSDEIPLNGDEVAKLNKLRELLEEKSIESYDGIFNEELIIPIEYVILMSEYGYSFGIAIKINYDLGVTLWDCKVIKL